MINVVRPRFLPISHERSDIELMHSEMELQVVIQPYENDVFGVCPAPMLVWQRTGDIVAASESFADMMQLLASLSVIHLFFFASSFIL